MEQWMSNSRNSSCNFFDAIEAPPVSSIERKLKRKRTSLRKILPNLDLKSTSTSFEIINANVRQEITTLITTNTGFGSNKSLYSNAPTNPNSTITTANAVTSVNAMGITAWSSDNMHVIPPAVPTSEAVPSHPTSSNFPATGAQDPAAPYPPPPVNIRVNKVFIQLVSRSSKKMKPTDDFEEILRRVDRDLMSALGMNDEVMVKYLSGILAIYQQRMQTQELLRSLNSNEMK